MDFWVKTLADPAMISMSTSIEEVVLIFVERKPD